MTVWFTADWHLGHRNIIHHANRPFVSVEEMNTTIIQNYHTKVKPKDLVYFLGDLAWKPFFIRTVLPTLPGNIVFILGNHDKNYKNLIAQYCAVDKLVDTKVDGKPVTLCHYPMEAWHKSHYGAIHLHGHCHGTKPMKFNRMDVGVDIHNFFPISWEEIEIKFQNYSEGLDGRTRM